MVVWGKILTRGLEALISLLEILGLRGSRWEWKKRSWRMNLESRISAWENLERGVRTRMRMCPSCRTLVEGGARHCPSCGTSMHLVPGGGLNRAFRLILPGVGSVSMILVSVNVGMSLLVTLLGSPAGGPPGLGGLLSPSANVLCLMGAKLM